MRNYGKCPICHREAHLTKHHILPVRFFHGVGDLVYICRDCHDEVEREIPRYEQLPMIHYFAIMDKFIP